MIGNGNECNGPFCFCILLYNILIRWDEIVSDSVLFSSFLCVWEWEWEWVCICVYEYVRAYVRAYISVRRFTVVWPFWIDWRGDGFGGRCERVRWCDDVVRSLRYLSQTVCLSVCLSFLSYPILYIPCIVISKVSKTGKIPNLHELYIYIYMFLNWNWNWNWKIFFSKLRLAYAP